MQNNIHTRCMLVSFTESSFGNTKQDKLGTEAARAGTQAQEGRMKATKYVLPPSELEPLSKHVREWREWHKARTLPWLDSGLRVITTTTWTDYVDTEREQWRPKYETLKASFLGRYSVIRDEQAEQLGKSFNPRDYPSLEQMETRFAVKVDFQPLPKAEDFRCDLESDTLTELRETYERQLNEGVDRAKAEIAGRLIAPLEKMVARLAIPHGQKGGRFQDTLVSNVAEAVAILPSLEFVEIPGLNALRERLDVLSRVDPEDLRNIPTVRTQTHREALEAMERVKACFPGLAA